KVSLLTGIQPGAEIVLSMATVPEMGEVRTAIGGGPILIHDGKKQPIPRGGGNFAISSMTQRHPRSAVGWNTNYFFLIEVDGRQQGLSVGMTLDELADFMARLGCTEAMNLDGGGSATFWANGRVRNSPCEEYERSIANALIL